MVKNDLKKRIISLFAAGSILLSLFSSSDIVFSEKRGDTLPTVGVTASAGDATENETSESGENSLNDSSGAENETPKDETLKDETSKDGDAEGETNKDGGADTNGENTLNGAPNSSTNVNDPSVTDEQSDIITAETSDKKNEFGLYDLMTADTNVAKLWIFSSSSESNVQIKEADVKTSQKGLEVVKGYVFEGIDNKADTNQSSVGDATEIESLWVKADVIDSSMLDTCEYISLYNVVDNKLEDVIVEDISELEKPVELSEEVNVVALVKDTGFRHIQFEIDTNDDQPKDTDGGNIAAEKNITEDATDNETVVENDNKIDDKTGKILVDENTVKEIISIDDEETEESEGKENIQDYKSDNPKAEEEKDRIITLNGMMPTEAIAKAVDVTEQYAVSEAELSTEVLDLSTSGNATEAGNSETESVVLAAYDITIKDGDSEYQPGEERPIAVEIKDSRISKSDDIDIWHIKDDGEREEIKDFTIEDGKVCFDATGFSVYEILGKYGKINEITDIADLSSGDGLILYCLNGKYVSNTLNGKGCFTEVDDISSASIWYLEKVNDNEIYIYTEVNGSIKYVSRKGTGNEIELTDSKKTSFVISEGEEGKYIIKHSTQKLWLQHSNGGGGIRFYGDSNDKNNSRFKFFSSDVSGLDGKAFGLMNYTGGTHGYALMAGEDNVHSLVELVTRSKSGDDRNTLYVDEGSEVTEWTFHRTSGDNYKLSAETENGTKYLAVSGDKLVLADSLDGAAEFTATMDDDGKVLLSNEGKYVTFNSVDNGESTVNSFILSSESSPSSWLNFIDFSALSDSDYISYSADRISMSDAIDGEKVIVYTRIWNETTKKYDIYAIDYNGNLYPCYANGGKILWLGDGTGSLEWVFTEYRDAVTKEINYYYELYNPYSEKYLAPQLDGDQILSDNPIGINLPGRKNGDFYGNIIAWDKAHYAYIGMKPNEDNTKLIPCSQSASIPFYFGRLEELNLNHGFHEIDTVDNFEHGITMKMQDFNNRTDMSNFLGTNDGGAVTTTVDNILSTKLNDDGYPSIVKGNNAGKSLAGLYNNPVTVNKLFIKSVYEASGYFEFDSCQNFATLCKDDGTLKDMTTVTDSKGNNIDVREYTVYRELGTTEIKSSCTLQHGQFLPYDNIVGKPVSKYQNKYSSLTNEKGTFGELDDADPRKYEQMYNVSNNPNYFNGMELEASFVQTVSGLDSWGHDMIFEFTGDDDFWLYVDGELVIDLGGIHSALSGNVNFRTGDVYVNGENKKLKQIFIDNFTARYKAEHGNKNPSEEEIKTYLLQYFQPKEGEPYGCEEIFSDYSVHKMKIFYMERGAGASNLHMKFNLASVTPGNVVVSKTVSGSGADSIDKDFMEYPFQIYYVTEEDPNKEILLNKDEANHIGVTYQESNQPVRYAERYRPAGFSEEEAYNNIFFINPTKNTEIHFPDNTISYRIVECAVDSTVYGKVLINGKEVPANQTTENKGLISYSSDISTAETRPTIAFDNVVNDNVIKELKVKKKIIDEDGNEIHDDDATFDFRLRISPVDVGKDGEIPLANMYKYYILSPSGKLCKYSAKKKGFVETSLDYTKENIDAVKKGQVSGVGVDDITFATSPSGAISGIPADYTICVPGLTVGSIFKVTEDVKPGYGIKEYHRVDGELVEEGESHVIPSYYDYYDNPVNTGKVRIEESPQMEVINQKGYSLTIKKNWSDLDLTTSHDPIYVAVFVDGRLLDGTVKKVESPSTEAYYFWPQLEQNADGTERTDFTGYSVRELKITSGTPQVNEDGIVTNVADLEFTALEKRSGVEGSDEIDLTATRTDESTPAGEQKDKVYTYVASYEDGKDEGSTIVKNINNIRKGGIAIRLFKWDSDIPLDGGEFTLKDSSGNVVGNYTSDSEGLVTMMYSFNRGEMYTLTQISAPKGYVGLQKTLKFKVNEDGSASLYYEDGVTEWGTDSSDPAGPDLKWANTKNGENGISAFIDIYNKQFNFKIAKMDSADNSKKLGAAHFALYKQANTTISGYVKNKDPMTGFEDMVTVNGEVDICGGKSKRAINPGKNGSVYFLTETQAPLNYDKLDEDIVFRISPLGVPSLISDAYKGSMIQTEDSYIYTLSVPNTKLESNMVQLNITKTVTGNMGNKSKDFDFSFAVKGDKGKAEYKWMKNDVLQTEALKSKQTGSTGTGASNGMFTMGHGDTVSILVPVNSVVTISEDNQGYKSSFKLGENDAQEVSSLEITMDADKNLDVTNNLEGILPTGVETHFMLLILSFIGIVAVLALLIRNKRRLQQER